MKSRAVVLLSGGMDSCVAVAIAAREFRLCLMHVRYGQRTEKRELESFRKIVDWYRPEENLVLNFDYLSQIGGSSLTDPALPVPEAGHGNEGIPSTYVPFRNAGFLSAAVSWGEVLGAEAVYIGAVEEDSSGYPDCREAFVAAFQDVVNVGTRSGQVLIRAPLLHMSKAGIVQLGISLGAPFHCTWSCYRRDDIACGNCASCALRLRGFREAGVKDPIRYLNQENTSGISSDTHITQ